MAKHNDAVSDPFDYLRQDHDRVKKLVAKLQSLSQDEEKEKNILFEEIYSGLVLHAAVENQVLYPVLEEMKKTHDVVLESFEEHHVIQVLLDEIDMLPLASDGWGAKLEVMKENLEHHMKEEEGENGMFPKAEKALTKEQKEDLRQKMEEFLAKESAATVA